MFAARRLLVVDPRKCSGCRICELVCSKSKEGAYNPRKSRIHVVRIIESEFSPRFLITAVACRFCSQAPCVTACPRDALKQSEQTGIIMLDNEKCHGCGWCIEACEFGALTPDPHKKAILMCDLCKGEVHCVKACPTGALEFLSQEAISQKARKLAIERLFEQT